jgi:uncharacterized protein (DUF2342 family)
MGLDFHVKKWIVETELPTLERLAASKRLSPRAAATARNLARGSRTTLAAIHEHMIRGLFPPHHRENARSLVARLHREGASPDRIEGMLHLAREAAMQIDMLIAQHKLNQRIPPARARTPPVRGL